MFRSKEKAVAVLWHTCVIISCVVLLYKWERYFNYPTTHEPAQLLWGDNPITLIFAQAIVGVDIIFLAHTVLRAFVWKQNGETFLDAYLNDKVATGMSAAWGVATTVDLFFTWFWFQGQQQIIGTSARIPNNIFEWNLFGFSAYDIIPVAGSILSWIAQAAIILAIARSIEHMGTIMNDNSYAGYGGNFRPNRQSQQQRPNVQVFHNAHNQQKQEKYQPQHRPNQNNQTKPKPIPRPEPSYQPIGWKSVDMSANDSDLNFED